MGIFATATIDLDDDLKAVVRARPSTVLLRNVTDVREGTEDNATYAARMVAMIVLRWEGDASPEPTDWPPMSPHGTDEDFAALTTRERFTLSLPLGALKVVVDDFNTRVKGEAGNA